MGRKLVLGISVGLWVLVAWFWVAWPGLGYLQARDTLSGISSWDIWRSLIVGPLDQDSLPPSPSTYQYVLLYGNWLFGWGVLLLGLATTGRLLDDSKSNNLLKLSYGFLGVVVVVFLVFGNGGSQPATSYEPDKSTDSKSVDQEEDDSSETTTTIVKEWSYGFRALQERMISNIESGSSYLLAHREERALYTKWAEWASLTALSFQAASDDILELLIQLDDEGRPDSYKDYFAREMDYLNDVLQNTIRYVGELGECARTSTRDGDCQEVLGRVFRSVDEANNKAVVR